MLIKFFGKQIELGKLNGKYYSGTIQSTAEKI